MAQHEKEIQEKIQEEIQMRKSVALLKKEQIQVNDAIEYAVKNGKLLFDPASKTIVGYTGEPTEVVIPEKIENIPVKIIGAYCFESCKSITSLEIADSVTEIQDEAFCSCTNLKSAKLPTTLSSMGDLVFVGCSSLETVSLPNGITYIPRLTFRKCESLKTITIPETVTEIGYWAFLECTQLTSVILPSGLTKIASHAFGDCRSLSNINLPNTLVQIGESAFCACTSLKEIQIPHKLSVIEPWTFCEAGLESIFIPNNIEKIGNTAFCTHTLKNVIFQNTNPKLTYLGEFSFSHCIFEEITLPSSVVEIAQRAFYACNKLRIIQIPSSTTSIRDLSFEYCDYLTIKGSRFSYAELYANTHNIPFIATDIKESYTWLRFQDAETKQIIPNVTGYVGAEWISAADGLVKIHDSWISNRNIKFSCNAPGYYSYTATVASLTFDAVNVISLAQKEETVTWNSLNINTDSCSGSCIEETLYGPEYEIAGEKGPLFELPISYNFSFFDVVKINNNIKEKRFEILIGDFSDEADINLQSTKELVANLSSKTNIAPNILKSLMQYSKSTTMVLGIEITTRVCGYMEINYDGILLDGGIGIMCDIGYDLYIPIIAIPVYATVGLSGGFNDVIYLEMNQNKTLNLFGTIDFNIAANGGVGVGIPKFLNAEIGVEAGFNLQFRFPLEILSKDCKIYFSGKAYFEYHAFCLENKHSIEVAKCQLYPPLNKSWSFIEKKNEPMHIGLNTMTLTMRPTSPTLVSMPRPKSIHSNGIHVQNEFLLDSVYSYCEPQMVELSDGKLLMVWVGDDFKRTNINRAALMYSIYNDGIWSNINQVQDDGTTDGSPRLLRLNDKIYLLWQNQEMILDDTQPVEEVITYSNLWLAQFQENSFNVIAPITYSARFELMPTITCCGDEIIVAWVENERNDIYSFAGKNIIQISHLNQSGGMEYFSNYIIESKVITNLVSTVVNGQHEIAFTLWDPETSKTNLYTAKQSDTSYQELCADVVGEIQYENNRLYWISNNQLLFKDLSSDVVLPVKVAFDFGMAKKIKVLSRDNIIRILMIYRNNETDEIYEIHFDEFSQAWSQPVALTNLQQEIRDFTAVLTTNEEIVLSVVCPINTDDENEQQSSRYNNIYIIHDPQPMQLTILETGYDESSLTDLTKVKLWVEIRNDSLQAIDEVGLILKTENQNVISTETLTHYIPSGKRTYLEWICDLSNCLADTYIVTVSFNAETVAGQQSNSHILKIAYADIAMEKMTVNSSGSTKEISAKFINKGFCQISEGVVEVYGLKENNHWEMLLSDNVVGLQTGESIEKMFIVPASDYRIYQTKVSIPEKEIYYENNIAYAAELQTRTTPLSVLYVEYVRKSALLLKSYIQNNTNSIQTVTITIYVYDQDDNYKKTSYERTMQFPASGILTVTCNIPDVETGEYLVLSASNDEGIIMDGHTRIKII